jgi:DNA-binding response OmpR family regulator
VCISSDRRTDDRLEALGRLHTDNDRRARILVADDEPSIRTLITRILVRSDMEVDSAVDGQDAIDKLDHASYDALVLDLMMPRVDGAGVLEHLRRTRPGMQDRTVLVTAFPQTAIERLGTTCRVLTKPFDVAVLIAMVRECVDSPNRARESEPGTQSIENR